MDIEFYRMDFIFWCIGISDFQKKQYISTANSNVGIRDYLVGLAVQITCHYLPVKLKKLIGT